MAWLYVPGTEGLKPPCTSYCPDIELFVLSNGKPTPQPPSWSGWKKRDWARVLCGMTLPPSTLTRGVDSWISSLRDTRASRSVTPEKVFAKMTHAICGLTSTGISASLCRQSSGLKTSRLTLSGVSVPSETIWNELVTELQRESLARQKLARRIFENASLFSACWPTVTVHGNHNRKGASQTSGDGLATAVNWPTPRASDGPKGGPNQRGSKGDLMLPSAVQDWATPTASVATGGQTSRGGDRKGELLLAGQAKWGTPTARDWKGPGMSAQLPTDVINGRGPQDAEKNNTNGKSPGSLNPEWVEQLMGWVPGMSNFSVSETGWSRWLALWRSFLFGKS